MTLKNLALYIIRNILATLNALTKVALSPTDDFIEKSSKIPIKVASTIIKSNLFQLSLKYADPKDIILIIASIKKTTANT